MDWSPGDRIAPEASEVQRERLGIGWCIANKYSGLIKKLINLVLTDNAKVTINSHRCKNERLMYIIRSDSKTTDRFGVRFSVPIPLGWEDPKTMRASTFSEAQRAIVFKQGTEDGVSVVEICLRAVTKAN
jgi:hypothetical protein